MLRLFAALRRALRVDLFVAHFNHRWRQPDSDGDARWVQRLSSAFGLPCVVGAQCFPRPTSARRAVQSESEARTVRYRFLRWAAEYFRCSAIATAHTLNDQAETVLHHLLRGSGLSGIRGIPGDRPIDSGLRIVRPLLTFEREELVAFLDTLGQKFRTDPTNQEPARTRNAIRHELLPQLQRRYNPRLIAALGRLARQASEAELVVRRLARRVLRRARCSRTDGAVELELSRLRGRSRHLLRQVFVELWQVQDWPRRKMTFRHWNAAADVVQGRRVQTVCPDGVIVRRRRGRLLVERSHHARRAADGH
ncbi:MAG: tRNA lysidine(34) synthetase TilS [Planctomycetota bacterium]|nr:MAG: tRNA lysidine(34) synthetase TilS [Planctomycetota bacterium]